MKAIVIYKSKYGATRTYAKWIADSLGCEAAEAKTVSAASLAEYDTIVYGGGLYAEIISGVNLITKNFDKLSDKKIAVYTTGLTPPDCRDYYENMVNPKNFKPHMLEKIKVFNFNGKMVVDELSLVHKTAIKSLKKIMSGKENPSDMEKLLIELCYKDGDFTDRAETKELIDYING